MYAHDLVKDGVQGSLRLLKRNLLFVGLAAIAVIRFVELDTRMQSSTFEMSGDWKRAKHPEGHPLGGSVSFRDVHLYLGAPPVPGHITPNRRVRLLGLRCDVGRRRPWLSSGRLLQGSQGCLTSPPAEG